jgi:hypothetical protein
MSDTNSKNSSSQPRVLPPPAPHDNVRTSLHRYGAVRDEDGRVMRKTGRTVQFATIVTPDFKDWIKGESKRRSKRMCVLLEDMRLAYELMHKPRQR